MKKVPTFYIRITKQIDEAIKLIKQYIDIIQ